MSVRVLGSYIVLFRPY